MRGRKPDENAVRRGTSPAREYAKVRLARAETPPQFQGPARKPALVEASDELSYIWDEMIGDGSAYVRADEPLLEEWVYYTAMVRQIMAHMLGKDGNSIGTMLELGDPDAPKLKPSPYFRQLRDATETVLRIAEHFGGTPMARARIGLTQAASRAVADDVRSAVVRAVERAARSD